MFRMFVRVGIVARLSTVCRAKSSIDSIFSDSDFIASIASGFLSMDEGILWHPRC